MSTVKISELPVLSSADAADEFVVVDDSAGVTKKITFDSLATDVRSESEPLTASTVTASGLVTASAGINFGSDTLDDYEEGTWTATVNEGTIDRSQAYYVKIGNIVHIWGAIGEFSNTSSTNSIQVSGIPFTPQNIQSGLGSHYPVGAVSARRIPPVGDHGVPSSCAFDSNTLRFYAMQLSGNFFSGVMRETQYSDLNDAFARLSFSITYQTF